MQTYKFQPIVRIILVYSGYFESIDVTEILFTQIKIAVNNCPFFKNNLTQNVKKIAVIIKIVL